MPKKRFKHSEITKQKQSESHIGQIPWNKGKTKDIDERLKKAGQNISIAKKGISVQEQHKLNCQCPFCKIENKGEKNPRWKGGNKNYWSKLSRQAWEEYHGRKIPPGGLIHHKDGNVRNLSKKNLELIATESGQLKDSQGKHISWHATLRKLKKRTKEFLNKKVYVRN